MNIKKAIASLFALFLVCPLIYGQYRRDFTQELDLGVNGGVNFSKVSFLHNEALRLNELGNQSFRSGSRFGVSFRYISQNHFGLQMELNYVQAGWKESYEANVGDSLIVNDQNLHGVTLSRRLEYLEIPILAHIYFGNKVRLFFNLGPELSILVNYKDLESNINMADNRMSAFLNDDPRFQDKDFSRLDYGLTGGMGVNFFIGGKIHATLEGRYTYGFNDLYSNNKSDVFQRSNNQYLEVMASIFIPLAKFKGN